MSNKNKHFIFLSALLIITTLACGLENIQVVESPNLEATITAQALLIQQGSPIAPVEQVVVVITATPDSAAATETVVPAAIVAVSPPAGAVTVTVSTATNCRTGPGQNFSIVYGMPINQVAEVVAKNTYSGYWIIKIPGTANTCWLWGQYATVTGNTAALSEVVTPTSAATKKPTSTVTITPSITVAAPAIPAAPSGLQANISCVASSATTTTVSGNISWADNSNNELNFIVGIDGLVSKTLGPNVTSDSFSVDVTNTALQQTAPGGAFTVFAYSCSGATSGTCSAYVSFKQTVIPCP